MSALAGAEAEARAEVQKQADEVREKAEEDRRQLEQLLQERARLETGLADLTVRVAGRDVAGLAAVQAQLTPKAAMLAWVDNYCSASPLDTISDATIHLVYELEKKAAE
jgi:phage host-nuclease inhibitor protein Gam